MHIVDRALNPGSKALRTAICGTLNRRLQPLRYLHDCSDCFRWSGCRMDLHPLESAALARRTPQPDVARPKAGTVVSSVKCDGTVQ